MKIDKIGVTVLMIIVFLIVVFSVLKAVSDPFINAGDNVSASELPLAPLFSGRGVSGLILMTGVLITIIGVLLSVKIIGWQKA